MSLRKPLLNNENNEVDSESSSCGCLSFLFKPKQKTNNSQETEEQHGIGGNDLTAAEKRERRLKALQDAKEAKAQPVRFKV